MSTISSETSKAGPNALRASRRWLYPLLLAMETVGVLVIYWVSLPLYRQLLADPNSHDPQMETRIWTLAGTALVQIGFWVRFRVRPAMPQFVMPLVGQLTKFWAQLSFIPVTAIFSFVFIIKKLESGLSISAYVVMLAALFSLFCYRAEIDRLGSAMMGEDRKPDSSRTLTNERRRKPLSRLRVPPGLRRSAAVQFGAAFSLRGFQESVTISATRRQTL